MHYQDEARNRTDMPQPQSYPCSQRWPAWRTPPFELYALECGGGGDCLFRAVARPLGVQFAAVRGMVAETLRDPTRAARYVQTVAEDQAQHLPSGSHPVDSRMPARELRALVRTPGLAHQGTDQTLKWLSSECRFFRQHNIGFVMFSTLGPGFTSVVGDPTQVRHLILLLNIGGYHWQLAHVRARGKLHACVSGKAWTSLLRAMRRWEQQQQNRQPITRK